jgi:glycosyltransferase involved in cell wall biosynthesis
MLIAIIPSYNEEKNIRSVVEGTKRYVDKVIVIDDGSCDKTYEEALKGGATVYRNKGNLGKADAMKIGFSRALDLGADFVLTIDGDGQHNPDEIPKFVSRLNEGFDLVVGARKFDTKQMPVVRIFANSFSSFLSSLACNTRIFDSQSGFRLIKRRLVEKIKFESRRYEMETEMLIKAARCGFKIGFIEIDTIYRMEAKSKINQILDPLRFLLLVLRLSFWRCK